MRLPAWLRGRLPDRGGEFDPDWTVRPGRTIEDMIVERHLAPAEFAALCSLSEAELAGVLEGGPLTDAFAAKLAAGTETSESFWRAREANYRSDLAAGRTEFP